MSFLATDLTKITEVEVLIEAADGILPKTLLSAQVVETAPSQLYVSNSDTIDHNVQVLEDNGSGPVIVASDLVPAGSGFGNAQPVDCRPVTWTALTNPTPRGPGVAWTVRVEEAVSALKRVTVQANFGVY